MPFQKGNQEWKKRKRESPGRPPKPIEEKYLRWLRARVKRKDWIYIVDTAMARAKAGDHKARQWLSDWCLGKPVERREHDVIAEILVGWDDGNDDEADDPVQPSSETEDVSR